MPRSAAAFPILPGSPAKHLRPPPGLSLVEKTLFLDIVIDHRPEHFKFTDGVLLVAYVRAVLDEREAAAHLEAEGRVIDGKLSPWLSVRQQAHKAMLSFARALRLGPLGRAPSRASRPQPLKPSQTLSYYDRMNLELDHATSEGDDAA
jgi:hypothetical protein